MEKCSPVEMRKNLEFVEIFKNAGIDFVAIPVFGEYTKNKLINLLVSQNEGRHAEIMEEHFEKVGELQFKVIADKIKD